MKCVDTDQDDIMREQQGGHLRSAHTVTRSTRLHLYSKPRCSFRKMFAFYRNLLHLPHRSCSGCEVQPQHVRQNHRQKLFITISILADSCGPLLLQRALKKKANLKKLFFCSFKTHLQEFSIHFQRASLKKPSKPPKSVLF